MVFGVAVGVGVVVGGVAVLSVSGTASSSSRAPGRLFQGRWGGVGWACVRACVLDDSGRGYSLSGANERVYKPSGVRESVATGAAVVVAVVVVDVVCQSMIRGGQRSITYVCPVPVGQQGSIDGWGNRVCGVVWSGRLCCRRRHCRMDTEGNEGNERTRDGGDCLSQLSLPVVPGVVVLSGGGSSSSSPSVHTPTIHPPRLYCHCHCHCHRGFPVAAVKSAAGGGLSLCVMGRARWFPYKP